MSVQGKLEEKKRPKGFYNHIFRGPALSFACHLLQSQSQLRCIRTRALDREGGGRMERWSVEQHD